MLALVLEANTSRRRTRVVCGALLSAGLLALGGCITVEAAPPTRADAGPPTDASTSDVSSARDGGLESGDAVSLRAGATVYSSNGHAYLVVCNGKLGWNEAKQAAEKAGGQLVSITSKEENGFVGALVAKPLRPECWDDYSGPWLGGQRNKLPDGGPGAWTWVTGEPWSDTEAKDRWHPSQPDNRDNKETALQAFTFSDALVWNDADPNVSMPGYVIEWDK